MSKFTIEIKVEAKMGLGLADGELKFVEYDPK